MTDTLRPLGKIVRLQIQPSPLKAGEKPHRTYDPSPLMAVERLALTAQGALARLPNGDAVLDVHHTAHPHSRNSGGKNDLSVGFTAHYDAMRGRFGSHLANGCAGENILVETDKVVEVASLAQGLVVQPQGNAAPVWLAAARVAAPCEPFTRYALGVAVEAAEFRQALQFLEKGMRGFYFGWEGEGEVTVAVGDTVWAP
ncbi:MAG: hypothetical protein HZB20_01000 [Chloroflexi bacterium]|nr:hypothetical protein [Chloroflexota bacterium]